MSLNRIDFQGNELLPERIAGALRTAILDNVVAPGARLREQDLAKSLGVSRVPLREALRLLAGEGMVVIQRHRGALVRERSDRELRELFAVRAMFESAAARLLVDLRPARVLDMLEAMIVDMKTASRAAKYDEYSRAAASFHDLIVAECGNDLLAQLYDRIRTNLRRYQSMMKDLPGSPSKSIREHEKILGAIRAGDAAGASNAAEIHVCELVRRFERSRLRPAESPVRKTRAKRA